MQSLYTLTKIKQTKLFSLQCSCETLLSNQFTRIENWSKILYQINQEILKASKNNRDCSKAFRLMCRAIEGVLQVVLFIVLWFKWSVQIQCVAKVLLAIWKIFLHKSNRNYNFYRFSYKFAIIVFLSFLTNQKQELGFQQVDGLVTRNVSVFFAYSESRSSSKPFWI